MFSWIKYINGLENENNITEKERELLENYCHGDKYMKDMDRMVENGEEEVDAMREAINNELKNIRD